MKEEEKNILRKQNWISTKYIIRLKPKYAPMNDSRFDWRTQNQFISIILILYRYLWLQIHYTIKFEHIKCMPVMCVSSEISSAIRFYSISLFITCIYLKSIARTPSTHHLFSIYNETFFIGHKIAASFGTWELNMSKFSFLSDQNKHWNNVKREYFSCGFFLVKVSLSEMWRFSLQIWRRKKR